MALYIKVYTAFYAHRKTLRLRARLGDDAFWIPPRLWAYAAEQQPDGDFSNYSAEEIAMHIAYAKNAASMLEALQVTGFMDGMTLHGWQEHNGYHHTYSARAKIAADSRWSKIQQKRAAQAVKPPKAQMPRPTSEEVIEFVLTLGLPASDGEACWHKWDGNGWKNGREPIKNWRSTIRSWKAAGYLPSLRQQTHKAAQRQPTTFELKTKLDALTKQIDREKNDTRNYQLELGQRVYTAESKERLKQMRARAKELEQQITA